MTNLNIERLIQPISELAPCGADLRQNTAADSLYYKIKDTRNLARDLERQQSMGMTLSGDEKPRWDKLLTLCIDALENHSKDLEILSWMIEALIREKGFLGLKEGFQITSQLIDLYWDFIYPLADSEDLEMRLAALNSLNGENYEGTLIRPIHHLPITQGSSLIPFALWQYQQAIENDKTQDKTVIEKRRAQGSVFLSDIYSALKESKPAFYENLISSIAEVKIALSHLNSIMDLKAGPQSFSSSQIINALDVFNEHITYLLKEAPFKIKVLAQETQLALENKAAEVVSSTEPDNSLSNTHSTVQSFKDLGLSSGIQNRDQALSLLAKVSDFFRETEPQSPLPYLLQRSINLGGLSFPDLLKELVNDEGARRFSYELLGIEEG
jgi:type VI secretion system protein ImpA